MKEKCSWEQRCAGLSCVLRQHTGRPWTL
jgi:hypothetical protein